jgi:hypothetical protein
VIRKTYKKAKLKKLFKTWQFQLTKVFAVNVRVVISLDNLLFRAASYKKRSSIKENNHYNKISKPFNLFLVRFMVSGSK